MKFDKRQQVLAANVAIQNTDNNRRFYLDPDCRIRIGNDLKRSNEIRIEIRSFVRSVDPYTEYKKASVMNGKIDLLRSRLSRRPEDV